MSDQPTLLAEPRGQLGKGSSRALRRQGRIPAVVYGGEEKPLAIHIPEKLLMKQLMTGHFMNSVVIIDVGDKKIRTLPKDVALHPVTDSPLHADFLRLAANTTVQVAIPVKFVNEEKAPGLKRGGVLNVVRHELELLCESDKIPDNIIIDVTGFDVSEAIHSSHVTLPEGVRNAITDRDFTIATIVAPSAMKSNEADTSEEENQEESEEDIQT